MEKERKSGYNRIGSYDPFNLNLNENHDPDRSCPGKGGIYMKWFDNTALTIVIIGAVNWLLVGIFRFDLVAFLFGNLSWLSRIIYTIVGICGLYLISLYGRMKDMTDVCS